MKHLFLFGFYKPVNAKGKKYVSDHAARAEERQREGSTQTHALPLSPPLFLPGGIVTHTTFVMLFLRRACCWRKEET